MITEWGGVRGRGGWCSILSSKWGPRYYPISIRAEKSNDEIQFKIVAVVKTLFNSLSEFWRWCHIIDVTNIYFQLLVHRQSDDWKIFPFPFKNWSPDSQTNHHCQVVCICFQYPMLLILTTFTFRTHINEVFANNWILFYFKQTPWLEYLICSDGNGLKEMVNNRLKMVKAMMVMRR